MCMYGPIYAMLRPVPVRLSVDTSTGKADGGGRGELSWAHRLSLGSSFFFFIHLFLLVGG